MGALTTPIKEVPKGLADFFSDLATHAVHGEAVPPAPDSAAWDKYLEDYGRVTGQIYRHGQEVQQNREAAKKAETQELQARGGLTQEELENRKYIRKLQEKSVDALQNLLNLGPNAPNYKDEYRRLSTQVDMLERIMGKRVSQNRPTYPTGRMAEAASLGGVDTAKPLQDYTDEDSQKLSNGYHSLEEKERQSTTSWTDQYGNETHTVRTEKTQTGGGQNRSIAPAPTIRTDGTPKKKDVGEEEYNMLQNGAKLTPKAVEAANRYAVRHGLSAPVSITPADKKSLAGLSNLEATFPDLEKYSSVLTSTVSRLKLRQIIESVTAKTGSAGALSSIEALIGAGIDAQLVKSLTSEEGGFLRAYNQARESVQTLRQFQGLSRSTQQLYNALAALIPNPYQTQDAAAAHKQIDALRKQIKMIREKVGTQSPTAQGYSSDDLGAKNFLPLGTPR